MYETDRDNDAIIARQADEIVRLHGEIKLLQEKVDHLIRHIHGAKSEQISSDQLTLLLEGADEKKPDAAEESEEDEPAADPAKDPHIGEDRKPRKPRQPRLPDNLPEELTVLIPPEVAANPDAYREISRKNVTRRLSVTPTRYIVELTVRPTFVLKDEPSSGFHTAKLPPCLLEKSILTPSLLAHVLNAKYCEHLPLHRQEQILLRRHGIHIGRNTLAEWVEIGAEWLETLYKLLIEELLEAGTIKIDETWIDYLAPGNGTTKSGYLWVYNSKTGEPDKDIVLYSWHTGRGHQHLESILGGGGEGTYAGLLQTDGYQAYQTWRNKHSPSTIIAGCWAHFKRKFLEALPGYPRQCVPILRRIKELYRIERKAARVPPDRRPYYRQRHSLPLIKRIYKQIEPLRDQYPPSTKMAEAITYALNQRESLIVYCYHGTFDIDNNSSERAVRPTKLGAKNWLFFGSAEAGKRSAIIYTFIENIRRRGHDPYAYLEWVFTRLPGKTNQDDLRPLLPNAWIEQVEEQRKLAAQARETTSRAA